MGDVIAFILDQIISPFWPYILAALGVVGAFLTGRMGGAAKAKAKQAAKDAKGYRQTTERIQDADAAMGDDPAVLRDSLRQRDPKQR